MGRVAEDIKANFHVIGIWLFRAYVISTLAPSAVNLHPLIYDTWNLFESLVYTLYIDGLAIRFGVWCIIFVLLYSNCCN